MAKIRKHKPIGYWVSGPVVAHPCNLPAMPKHAPADLIYRCPGCQAEWTWQPS